MSNITVTTNQNIIEVTETGGVNVTNTTDEITILTAGTLIIEDAPGTITSVNGQTGPVVVLDTDDIPEGTNKYFSQALARGSLSAGTGINYNTGTGVITNTSINTDTTYTIDAATTSGGANLNLVGSDATTDSVKFASGTNVTVSRTDANTINIASTDTNTTYTIASASTTGGANLNLVGSDSTTDSVAYKGAGATTVTSTDANTVTITSTDTNTTYTQNASAVSGGANLNLVGSDSTTDSIKLASGTNVTVTRTDADTVTIASTDTNTTYTQNISSTSGGANLNLVGSDSTTDTVKFADGTGVTVAYTDDNTATVSIGQPVAITDNVQFNNITLTGDINDTGALQISTGANGNITLAPNGTGNVALTLNNGGNLTNTRNYVLGSIRQTAAASAGDVWGFLTGTTNPYRGISLDNSATSTTTTGKRTGIVMRNYANNPRNSIIGESARGTNPSSPTQLINGNNIIELTANGWAGVSDGSGFTSTGSTISGTTLTIGTLVTGTPAVGQLISSYTFGAGVTTGTTITANISGSGSGSTWTVSTSQTVGSAAINGGGDGWLATINGIGGQLRLQAAENWTNQTAGTGMIVVLSPLAATNGIAGNTATALSLNLSSTNFFSDAYTFNARPAGVGGTGANYLSLSSTLTTVAGDLRVNGNDILAGDGNTNITMAGNTLTTVAGDLRIGGNDIQNSSGSNAISMSSGNSTLSTFSDNTFINNAAGKRLVEINEFVGKVGLNTLQSRATSGNEFATSNWATYRSTDGINYTPTQLNDVIGEFKFNGNANTSTSPGVPAGPGGNVVVQATENWTNSANGTTMRFLAIKQGTLDSYSVFSADPVGSEFKSDSFTFKTAAASPLTTLTIDSSGNVTLAGDLRINGNDIKSSDGATAITLAPVTGFNPNVDFPGNIVKGVIRTGAGEANGNIFEFIGGANPSTGISIDNTDKPADRTSIVLRNYGASLIGGLPRTNIISEVARGTAAVPVNVGLSDNLFEIQASGYTSAGWLGDLVNAPPGIARFRAAEAWTNGVNNVGTTFQIVQQPTATALTAGGASLITTFANNPQATTIRSDTVTVLNKAGTQTLFVDSSGNLNTAGNISTTTGSINASGAFDSNEALSSTANLLDTNTAAGSSVGITTKYWTSSAKTTLSVPQNGNKLGNFRFNSNSDSANTYVLGAQVISQATENWTPTANGSSIVFAANKQGQSWTTGHTFVINASPESAQISSDVITLESNAGADFAVLNANTAKFNVPVTTEITTTTISEGTTYTPAATVDNNISVQINVLAGGTTVIDLASLTGNSRGASYNILVFNNTGSGTPIQVKNTRINTNNLMTHTITTGNRIIINAYVVGDYATATHLNVA